MTLETYLGLLSSMPGMYGSNVAWQQAEIAQQQNALANYYFASRPETSEDYDLKQEAWRKTVSQNWLNALLDVEIGLGARRMNEWQPIGTSPKDGRILVIDDEDVPQEFLGLHGQQAREAGRALSLHLNALVKAPKCLE